MSRVGEAFNRAFSDTASEKADTGRVAAVEESMLDLYPAERSPERREHSLVSFSEVAQARLPRAPKVQSQGRPDPSVRQAGLPTVRLRSHTPLTGDREGAVVPVMDGKVVGTDAAPPALIEQYRRLAAALLEMQGERGVKTVMVSSALSGEGKTLTVTNLAMTLAAHHNQRVLLIDADLLHPSIHEIFQLSNETGLSEGLGSKHEQIRAVVVSPFLTVVAGGRVDADPMAALVSSSMRHLILESTPSFDWVLLDTPPVSLLEDAHLLAWLTDGVLLVVKAGVTPYKAAADALAEFGRDRVIGVVLNRAGKHVR